MYFLENLPFLISVTRAYIPITRDLETKTQLTDWEKGKVKNKDEGLKNAKEKFIESEKESYLMREVCG